MVPPNQAEDMYKGLKERGVTTGLVLFDGEQHGFRGSNAIRRAMEVRFGSTQHPHSCFDPTPLPSLCRTPRQLNAPTLCYGMVRVGITSRIQSDLA